MVRKQKRAPKEDIESVMKDSVKRVGIQDLEDSPTNLLLRLVVSGIAKYFFEKPDNVVDVGYLRFKKSPVKEELFTVEIIKNEKEGVINADTLWRYYTGELTSEKQLKEVLNNFMEELVEYSQNQEIEITKLTGKLNK